MSSVTKIKISRVLKENVNTSSCSPQMYGAGHALENISSSLQIEACSDNAVLFSLYVFRLFFPPSTKGCEFCTYYTEWAVWGRVCQQVVLFCSIFGNLRICLNLKAVLSFLQLLMSSSTLAPPVRYFAFQSLLTSSDLRATCLPQTTEAQRNQRENFCNIMLLKCFS